MIYLIKKKIFLAIIVKAHLQVENKPGVSRKPGIET
jgi:hypothetical protein